MAVEPDDENRDRLRKFLDMNYPENYELISVSEKLIDVKTDTLVLLQASATRAEFIEQLVISANNSH